MIINKLFEKNSRGWSYADYAKVVRYLIKYGYLVHQQTQEIFKDNQLTASEVVSIFDSIENGLDKLQEFLGPKDNVEILKVIDLPRCAVPDFIVQNASVRKWGRKNLTYYIEKRDSDLPADTWDAIVAQAWQQWSDVAGIKFSRVNSSNANVIVSIGRGQSQSFDGPNGTLAWAQLPPSSNFTGRLLTRADADERWITSGNNGILLLNVLCHEFGHILGLEHSSVKSALMAPFYSPTITKPQSRDDIPRIVNLYGEAETDNEPTPKPEEPNTPVPTNGLTIKVNGNVSSIEIPGYRVSKLD